MGTETTAYGAFESQLKTLCLNEFPCGIGPWKENYGQKRKHIEKDKVNSRFVVTLKGYGAEHEKTETLEELVTAKQSPWNIDYSWSDEARRLREIAVQSPWLIDKSFVLQHFKTLRIIDKGVREVDPQISQFTCLEELFLSANKLVTIDSSHLPHSLRVLELAANEISNLGDLCSNPPPLSHLGLGYNLLTLVDDYITGAYWPSLLSLDLSHNNLCDLIEIVRKLQSLPKLGNLILQGNPLSLLAAYRGYTVDTLKRLAYLDDITISADERYLYKGLSKKKECILDEAKVSFHVAYIKGVPKPEELQNPEDQPEFPIITRKYFVQFMYPEERVSNTDVLQVTDMLQDVHISETDSTAQHNVEINTIAEDSGERGTGSAMMPEIQLITPSPAMRRTPHPAPESIDQLERDTAATPSIPDADISTEPKLLPVKSSAADWAEEMPLQWTNVVTRDDLLTIRNFYREGMEVAVIEETVKSYPPDQLDQPSAPSPVGSKRSGSVMGKKKEVPPAPSKTKPAADKGGDPKKKGKKEPEIDLVHMPPEYKTLATFHMPLGGFLESEYKLKKVFTLDWETGPRSMTPTNSEVSSRKQEAKGKKPGSAKANKGKKDDKAKKVVEVVEEGEPPPPPPLEIQIRMRLHHWKTAFDSLKPDPDEIKMEQTEELEEGNTTLNSNNRNGNNKK